MELEVGEMNKMVLIGASGISNLAFIPALLGLLPQALTARVLTVLMDMDQGDLKRASERVGGMCGEVIAIEGCITREMVDERRNPQALEAIVPEWVSWKDVEGLLADTVEGGGADPLRGAVSWGFRWAEAARLLAAALRAFYTSDDLGAGLQVWLVTSACSSNAPVIAKVIGLIRRNFSQATVNTVVIGNAAFGINGDDFDRTGEDERTKSRNGAINFALTFDALVTDQLFWFEEGRHDLAELNVAETARVVSWLIDTPAGEDVAALGANDRYNTGGRIAGCGRVTMLSSSRLLKRSHQDCEAVATRILPAILRGV
jgi:hypothetical protein